MAKSYRLQRLQDFLHTYREKKKRERKEVIYATYAVSLFFSPYKRTITFTVTTVTYIINGVSTRKNRLQFWLQNGYSQGFGCNHFTINGVRTPKKIPSLSCVNPVWG